MPNWSSNALIVKSNGSKESERELDEFLAKVHSTKDLADRDIGLFSVFYPLPVGMDWYEWQSDNWGTKWDVGYNDITFVTENHMSFETAWAPPIKWLLVVSEQYPRLTFDIAYSEQGMAFAGVTTIENGLVLSEEDVTVGDTPTSEEWAEANPDADPDDYWDNEIGQPNADWQAHMDKYHIGQGG